MKLPTEYELRDGFNEFANFTFDLLDNVEADSKYLKFSAINSQIALELFLKYWFVRQGRLTDIQKEKNGRPLNNFISFSDILHLFYSSKTWSYGEKKEFIKLMEARNSIAHKAQTTSWNEELAKIIIRTLFFIHATAWSDFGETLLFKSHMPHSISENEIWKAGSESFALSISKLYDSTPQRCILCEARTVISGEIMALEEGDSEDDIICLNCLTSLDIENQINVITCYACNEPSYIIDILNEQKKQLYVGKCSECSTNTWVRKCKNCESFYHPNDSKEIKRNNMYFCSSICSELHEELYA